MKLVVENLEQLYEYSAGVVNKLRSKFRQERPALTDVQIDYYIQAFDKYKNSPKILNKDITSYTFKKLEELIDSNFPRKTDTPASKDTMESEAIYNKDGLTIYEGNTKDNCVKYGRGYPWCISRTDASNMFNTYRYRYDEINFYFIFDNKRNDAFQAMVLLVDNEGRYYVANKDNSGDFAGTKEFTWEQVQGFQPRIKSLRKLFKPRPLTKEEIRIHSLISSESHVDDLLAVFKSYDIVEAYIAYGHVLGDLQFKSLPYELKRKYINLGQELSGNQLREIKPADWNRYLELRTDERGNLHLLVDELPEGFKFPDIIYGSLYLSALYKLTADIKMPDRIVGNLYIEHIKSIPDNFVFPKEIGGSLRLNDVEKIGDAIKFPEEVGTLDLRSLEYFSEDMNLPREIGGGLRLDSLKKLPRTKVMFPEKIGGQLYLTSLDEVPKYIADRYSFFGRT